MDTTDTPTIRPFWQRLNTFFLFPLQTAPLLYALFISAAALLAKPLFMLFGGLALGVVVLGVVLAASRYACKVIDFGSRGILRVADYPLQRDSDLRHLPWKLFAVLLVQGLATVLVARVNPKLAYLVMLATSASLPAVVMVLVQSCSFREAVNPARAISTIRTIGWPYAALCVFLLLLMGGSGIATDLLLPRRSTWFTVMAFVFFNIYFMWVMAALIGYVMYQHHEALDIAPLAGAEREGDGPAVRPGMSPLDAQLAKMVGEGDIGGAVRIAGQALNDEPESIAAHRRFHRTVLLSGDTGLLLGHGQTFIRHLARGGFFSEALQVWRDGRTRDPAFASDDPAAVLGMARHAWRGGDADAALKLIAGFDRRFPQERLIPQVYALAAQVVVQHYHRTDQALQILRTLEARYPQSEQVQEVRWLLRDTLPAASAAPRDAGTAPPVVREASAA
ncbi:tol-pal system YbgF family protein [Xylophilus sp. Leaf220]|uniref:tetratricopeptide repeat protein n=1 Tax=Xylophilus sp. Leaf220 TaxID=1735686 RepID=UPI0006F58048|nr:hypothetical protein [Xylophilus sp. Leaf220]KQM80218.1 hypothetical protein ASE76_03445 [Xylophilus sp. Leaf220]